MKGTIKHLNDKVVQVETEMGLLLQLQRVTLDECCVTGYSEDPNGLICERRSELDPDGVWIRDSRGNGLRSFVVRVTF